MVTVHIWEGIEQSLHCRTKKCGGKKQQAELFFDGFGDSDEGEAPEGNPGDLEEEACLPGRTEEILENLESYAPGRPATRSQGVPQMVTERGPLKITEDYDIFHPVFAAGAVPEQPAAEAMKQPSPIRRGADRATRRPLNEADKAALRALALL